MARKVSPDSRPARLWTNKQAGRLLPFDLLFFILPGDTANAKRLAGTRLCRVSSVKVFLVGGRALCEQRALPPTPPIPQKLCLSRRTPSWHARSRPVPSQPDSGQTSKPDGCYRSTCFSSSRRGTRQTQNALRGHVPVGRANKSLGKGEGVREGEKENRFSKRFPSPPRIIITSPHPPKNFACPGASPRGTQSLARFLASQTLDKQAGRTAVAVRPAFLHPAGGRGKREMPCRDMSLSGDPNKSLGKGEGVREGERENRFSKRFPSPHRILITFS